MKLIWYAVGFCGLLGIAACRPLATYTADGENSRTSSVKGANSEPLSKNDPVPQIKVDQSILDSVKSLDIQFDFEGPVVAAGRMIKITALGITFDGKRYDVSSYVTWSVDQADLASADPATMLFKALKPGQVKLIASFGGITFEKSIEIGAAALVDYRFASDNYPNEFSHCGAINSPTDILAQFRGTVQIKYYKLFTDCRLVDATNEAVWSGNNPNVGKFNPQVPGQLILKASGNVEVTVNVNGQPARTKNLSVTDSYQIKFFDIQSATIRRMLCPRGGVCGANVSFAWNQPQGARYYEMRLYKGTPAEVNCQAEPYRVFAIENFSTYSVNILGGDAELAHSLCMSAYDTNTKTHLRDAYTQPFALIRIDN